MNPRNPLGRLVRLREIREEQARAALGAATRGATNAKSALDAAAAEYEARPALPELLTPAELRGLMLQGVRSQELVQAAAEGYHNALAQTDEARRAWSAASSDLRSAEKLDQRRRREGEHLAQVAADRALDEMVLTLRGIRRWI